MIRELQIDFAEGSAVVMKDGKIELTECRPFTVAEAEYLIEEVKAFIEYRKYRNMNKQIKEEEKDDSLEVPPQEVPKPCECGCGNGNCQEK